MRIADFEYASDIIFNLQCEIPKAHEEAEDAGRIPHGLELLPGVLPQAPPGGHRATRPLKFCAFLRDEKQQAPRTCWNRFSNVMSFLKAQGIRGMAQKNAWPRYVEEEPEIYEDEPLRPRNLNGSMAR